MPIMESTNNDQEEQKENVHKLLRLLKPSSDFETTARSFSAGSIKRTPSASLQQYETFELDEGENSLKLVPRYAHNGPSILDETQASCSSTQDIVAMEEGVSTSEHHDNYYVYCISHSSTGNSFQLPQNVEENAEEDDYEPSTSLHHHYLCFHVDGEHLAVIDMRPLSYTDGDAMEDEESPVTGISRIINKNTDTQSGIGHSHGSWERLERRQLRILKEGDKICTNLSENPHMSGVVLAYHYGPPDTRPTHAQPSELGLLTQPPDEKDEDVTGNDENQSGVANTVAPPASMEVNDTLRPRKESHEEDQSSSDDETAEMTQQQIPPQGSLLSIATASQPLYTQHPEEDGGKFPPNPPSITTTGVQAPEAMVIDRSQQSNAPSQNNNIPDTQEDPSEYVGNAIEDAEFVQQEDDDSMTNISDKLSTGDGGKKSLYQHSSVIKDPQSPLAAQDVAVNNAGGSSSEPIENTRTREPSQPKERSNIISSPAGPTSVHSAQKLNSRTQDSASPQLTSADVEKYPLLHEQSQHDASVNLLREDPPNVETVPRSLMGADSSPTKSQSQQDVSTSLLRETGADVPETAEEKKDDDSSITEISATGPTRSSGNLEKGKQPPFSIAFEGKLQPSETRRPRGILQEDDDSEITEIGEEKKQAPIVANSQKDTAVGAGRSAQRHDAAPQEEERSQESPGDKGTRAGESEISRGQGSISDKINSSERSARGSPEPMAVSESRGVDDIDSNSLPQKENEKPAQAGVAELDEEKPKDRDGFEYAMSDTEKIKETNCTPMVDQNADDRSKCDESASDVADLPVESEMNDPSDDTDQPMDSDNTPLVDPEREDSKSWSKPKSKPSGDSSKNGGASCEDEDQANEGDGSERSGTVSQFGIQSPKSKLDDDDGLGMSKEKSFTAQTEQSNVCVGHGNKDTSALQDKNDETCDSTATAHALLGLQTPGVGSVETQLNHAKNSESASGTKITSKSPLCNAEGGMAIEPPKSQDRKDINSEATTCSSVRKRKIDDQTNIMEDGFVTPPGSTTKRPRATSTLRRSRRTPATPIATSMSAPRSTRKRTIRSSPRVEAEQAAGKDSEVRVTWSQLEIDDKIIKGLNGQHVSALEDAHTASHFVLVKTEEAKEVKISRTPKLMIAICRSEHFVSYKWLRASEAQGRFLDAEGYSALRSKDTRIEKAIRALEKKFDFQLSQSLARAKSMRAEKKYLMSGFRVYLCGGVAGGKKMPSKDEFRLILEAAGASVEPTVPASDFEHILLVTSNEASKAQKQVKVKSVEKALKQGAIKMTAEQVFRAIISQDLKIINS